jgi:hypothetical protein
LESPAHRECLAVTCLSNTPSEIPESEGATTSDSDDDCGGEDDGALQLKRVHIDKLKMSSGTSIQSFKLANSQGRHGSCAVVMPSQRRTSLYELAEDVLRPTGPEQLRNLDTLCSHFQAHTMYPQHRIYDVNLFDAGMLKKGLKNYYEVCRSYRGHGHIIVTTSCFPVWKKAKKTNASAKVIPAVPSREPTASSSRHPRIFFFDDNISLNLGGTPQTEGICNLRDINTGEFVDFSVGKNGFACESFFRFTQVHHSKDYNNVLVQANIIDAMTIPNYFQFIISLYAKPGEILIVYFDVNGVLVWDDAAANKDVSEVLLSTMFKYVEVRPRSSDPVEFTWESFSPVSINKVENLRTVVRPFLAEDGKKFWASVKDKKFLTALTTVADIAWQRTDTIVSVDQFLLEFQRLYGNLQRCAMRDGMPESWFRAYKELADEGHHIILNSFGSDSFKVAKSSVRDLRQILQLTINYDMWSQKDATEWGAQFRDTSD